MSKILTIQEMEKNIFNVQNSLYGHEVHVANSAKEAMELLAHETFDLIICAVHLHSGSVYDLLSYAKNDPQHRETRFVFFCSEPGEIAQFVSDTTVATARLLGADGYITSYQFDAELFREEINALLKPGQALNEAQQYFASEQERVRCAVQARRFVEAEKILKELLVYMASKPKSYQPIQLAAVHHDLSGVLESEGKFEEAKESRESIEDF